MKKILLYIIICVSFVSCGKRCHLEPYEPEDVRYPRQYPQSHSQEESIQKINAKV
ncbi:MAG: hypothetical protein LBJ96_05270 [Holosporaceae bacterium]|nr:hypothetical protein [Holosporaceae bacterium]